jgi:undecaprenyl phosphate N,N'-diacetylbacillosamine 1-phosphate transferase
MSMLRPMSAPAAWRVKRLIDVTVSGTALVVLLPLLVGIALSIRLTMGRPILFHQQRIGHHEVPFSVYKFRSLSEAVDDDGVLLPSRERVTTLGWFLRRWSLDELPQFYNVLKGDLSLVGPRPLLPHYLPAYTEIEKVRHSVRPGITGLAQVSGRNSLTWDDKLALDVQYVEQWSLVLDARIAVQTIRMLLRSSSVARDPSGEGDLARLRGTYDATPPAPSRGRVRD